MVRLVLGAVLSAIVMFAFGFFWWGVSPLRFCVFKTLKDEDRVIEVLKSADLETGTYFAPFMDESKVTSENREQMTKELQEKYKAGPLVQIIYQKNGVDMMDPTVMITGFVHMIVFSLLAGVLLTLALPGLSSYSARVLFVFLLAVFASATIDLSGPIWFHHPWGMALYNSGYHAGCGLLSALVLGGMVRPRN